MHEYDGQIQETDIRDSKRNFDMVQIIGTK